MLQDKFNTPILKGRVKISELSNPQNVLFEDNNVICNSVGFLFARMMADINEPAWGVWGLALGGGNSWPAENQPDALPTTTTIVAPLLRKRLSYVKFVDADLNPLVTGKSSMVDFQTIINPTTDGLPSNTPIREIGLIAGGSATAATDMLTAPFFDPSTPNVVDSVVLVNYKTLPPLQLPAGINFLFSWILHF